MPSYIQLPNGKYMEVPEKLDDFQALELAQKKYPKMYGLEGEKGVMSGLKRSAEEMLSSGTAGIEALLGNETKAAQRALKRSEANQQFYEDQTGLDLVKKAYEEGGIYGGAKEAVRQVPLAMAEFAPQIGVSMGAAKIGALAGAATPIPGGALIGGALGAFAPSALQQLGGNIERQVAVQREKGLPEKVDLGAALPAAGAQGMLDAVGNFIPFGKGAVRGVLGKEGVEQLENVFGKRVATMLAKDDLQGAKKLLNESWKSTVAKGTATGLLAEVPTEVAQQVLERGQAGLDLMSPDALNEYLDTAYQMALISPFGAAGRYSDKYSAGKAREEKYAELTGARAERAQARFEEEETKRLASPQYLTQLETQLATEQAAAEKMQAALDAGKIKKPEKHQEKLDQKLSKITDLQAQIAAHPLTQSAAAQAQASQLEQLQAEETGAAGDIDQQRQAALAAQAEQAKQQNLAMGTGQQMAIPGAEPVVGPEARPDVATQRADVEAQTKTLSVELAKINARMEAQQKELAAAAAAGDTTKAVELMAQAEKDPTAKYKAEIEKQLEAFKAQAAELKKADPAEQLKALQKQFVKAGDEGNFEAIKVLAPQIEALKQQVPAPAAPEAAPAQQSFFGKEGEPTLFATQAIARREKEVAKENKPLLAAAKEEAGVRSAALASEEAELLAEQEAAPEQVKQTGLFKELAGVAAPQGRPEPAGSERVLGRPAQAMKMEDANRKVEDTIQSYREAMDELSGGYFLGGKNEKLAGPMDENLVKKEDILAQAEEAKAKVIDAALLKADNARLDRGMPRLDDQAAMALAGQINDIFAKHTSEGGMAPQMPGRITQAIAKYAKPTIEEKKRALSGKPEEFALAAQTEESLAAKVAEEEGAGKTNRSDVVAEQLQKALDTKPTGAISAVLEEAKRIVDTGKAPDTLLNEAEAQSLRILNGKTPQMRSLYDETVIAKEGKVTEEKQQHFPQFAQRGTIRQTAEKFRKFLSSPRIEYKRNEYVSRMKEFRKLIKNSNRYPELKNAVTRQIVTEYNDAVKQVDRDVQEMADYLKFLKTELARPSTPWAKEIQFEKEVAKVESYLKEAAATMKQMDSLLEERLTAVDKTVQAATVAGRKSAKEMAGLKTTTEAQRQQAAKAATAFKEAMDAKEKANREWDLKLEEATKLTPKVVSKVVEEEVSANDIRDWKKLRTQAQKELTSARKSLAKMPDDAEFQQMVADAETRLANVTAKLKEFAKAGASIKGQPKGTVIKKRVIERTEPTSKETVRLEAKEEAKKEAVAKRIAKIQLSKAATKVTGKMPASVIGIRDTIKRIDKRLAAIPATKQTLSQEVEKVALEAKRKELDAKLETILKQDRTMLAITRNEEIPGGMITPQKIVKGTNIAKVEEEARAEKAAAFREDEEAMADMAFAQATLLREAGPVLPEERQVDLNEAKKRADGIVAKLAKSGIKMEYYRSLKDAPAKVRAALKYHNATGAKGMIFPDGTVAVFGDMHESMRDLEETIAHEVIGHYGVEGALGAKGIQALADKLFETDGLVYRVAEALGVWNEVRATEQSAIERGLNANQQRVEMVRELIAHTAEKRGVPTGMLETFKRWVKLVVNAVRNVFGNAGMTDLTKATTKEIQKLIDTAERQYIENRLPAYQKPSGEVAFRSQAQYKPGFNKKLQRIGDQVIAKDKTAYEKMKSNLFGLNFVMQFVDRWAGLEHILDTKMKGSLAAMNVMYQVRGYDARNQLVAEMASHGPSKFVEGYSKDGKTKIMLRKSAGLASLKDIVQEVGKSKRIGNADAALKQFTLYAAAYRAKRVGIEKAFGRDSKITPADLDAIIREGDADPHFKKARQLYAEYNKGLIEFLYQAGGISRKDADELTRYGDYIGFYREKDGYIVDGEHAVKLGSLKDQKQLKELLGSDRGIVDFQTSSLQNTALIAEIALRNVATKATINALQDLDMTVVRNGPGPAGGNVVRFKDKGNWYHAIVDTDAAGVPTDLFIKGMEGIATTLPAAIRFMQGPANLLRKGVTRMPLYAPRQIIRDSMTSVMANGVDAVPVVSSLKSMWDKKAERALQEQGFLGGQVFSHTPDDMKRIMSDIASGKEGFASWMAKLDTLAVKADAAARITAYNSYIKQGMSELEASLAAAETINFTKRGISPGLNMLSIMIPFFNAQVQGLNVLYRSFMGKGSINQRLNTQAKLFKRGAIMAGMTMAYAVYMADDEAYKNATEEERYNNWFFYTPFAKEPLRIPIPFELGYVFKSIPEAIINVAMGDTKAKEALQGLKALFTRSIPGFTNLGLPQAIKPAIEAYTNYNFFTGRPIEGSRQLAIEPGKRRADQTTEVAASLGSLLNVSPIMIDHLIYGYTGGLGAALTAVLNPVLAEPTKPGAPETPLSKTPFIGAAFQPTDGRGIVNNANDTMAEMLQAKATAKRLVEEGRIKEADEYIKANANKIALAAPAQEYKNKMVELAKRTRAIRLSTEMTPKEKLDAVDAIQQQRIALAKQLRSIE